MTRYRPRTRPAEPSPARPGRTSRRDMPIPEPIACGCLFLGSRRSGRRLTARIPVLAHGELLVLRLAHRGPIIHQHLDARLSGLDVARQGVELGGAVLFIAGEAHSSRRLSVDREERSPRNQNHRKSANRRYPNCFHGPIVTKLCAEINRTHTMCKPRLRQMCSARSSSLGAHQIELFGYHLHSRIPNQR